MYAILLKLKFTTLLTYYLWSVFVHHCQKICVCMNVTATKNITHLCCIGTFCPLTFRPRMFYPFHGHFAHWKLQTMAKLNGLQKDWLEKMASTSLSFSPLVCYHHPFVFAICLLSSFVQLLHLLSSPLFPASIRFCCHPQFFPGELKHPGKGETFTFFQYYPVLVNVGQLGWIVLCVA